MLLCDLTANTLLPIRAAIYFLPLSAAESLLRCVCVQPSVLSGFKHASFAVCSVYCASRHKFTIAADFMSFSLSEECVASVMPLRSGGKEE